MRLNRAIERVKNRTMYLHDVAAEKCPLCQRATLLVNQDKDPRTSPHWRCYICGEQGFIANGHTLVDCGDIEVLAMDKEALDILAENAKSDTSREALRAYGEAIHAVRVVARGGPWLMRRVCCNCGKEIGTIETDRIEQAGAVTHIICNDCGPKLYPDEWPTIKAKHNEELPGFIICELCQKRVPRNRAYKLTDGLYFCTEGCADLWIEEDRRSSKEWSRERNELRIMGMGG